ncbi:NAD(P)/FAD-dependent oxidoreductase [Luteolibacter marinus]|uniref:NAD(P)/FAD-dependent oxidoreductase n=1 Tax=Luteolibacter marinus TaxID=2776705 RepID=UPI00186880B1|nr:NAD(P)/FAD-dependent oxidoreductase [Luteolibacter marinus]
MTPDLAILGAGPAGSTLAALLSQRGFKVLVFDDEKRPELLVGESLVPATVPVMRRLGIEDRVAKYSQHKPGVTFLHREGSRIDFNFAPIARSLPTYAYNIPRPEFDDTLRERAEELGAVFVKHRAVVEPGTDGREIQLSAGSLAAAKLSAHPAFLIDATGRARTFARALGIGAQGGERADVAYFAHFEAFEHDFECPGQVVISILDNGWCWRIPLPGRLSVGIVLHKDIAKTYGDTPEARLDHALRTEPLLRDHSRDARRVTPVMTYTNYQLVSERGYGPGWAACGDSFGFVDPMLSPGLFMALESARLFDEHVFSSGTAVLGQPDTLHAGFERAEAELHDWHESWRELIRHFYDGGIFSLYETGTNFSKKFKGWPGIKFMENHMGKHIASMASGSFTRRKYSRGLVRFMRQYMLRDCRMPEEFAVRP